MVFGYEIRHRPDPDDPLAVLLVGRQRSNTVNVQTDFTDPSTIDVDEVLANINHDYRMRGGSWSDRLTWPNVTVKALADEILRLRGLIEEAQLARIEAQNPGIDIERVARERAERRAASS